VSEKRRDYAEKLVAWGSNLSFSRCSHEHVRHLKADATSFFNEKLEGGTDRIQQNPTSHTTLQVRPCYIKRYQATL